MNRDDVQRWLDRYIDAWRTYRSDAIGALFSDDVSYRYQPYWEPLRGRDAVVADWLASPDKPDSWQARFEPYAVDGDRAVATGEVRYLEDGAIRKLYHNVWLLRFDADGRCTEFVEYWREQPQETLPAS